VQDLDFNGFGYPERIIRAILMRNIVVFRDAGPLKNAVAPAENIFCCKN
jgi:hypothetical protein